MVCSVQWIQFGQRNNPNRTQDGQPYLKSHSIEALDRKWRIQYWQIFEAPTFGNVSTNFDLIRYEVLKYVFSKNCQVHTAIISTERR